MARTTQLEVETRSIVESIPGFRMERSELKKYNRAVFDLFKDDVCVGQGFTCDQLQAIATVQGNISLMNAPIQEQTVKAPVLTAEQVSSIVLPKNTVHKLIIPGMEENTGARQLLVA